MAKVGRKPEPKEAKEKRDTWRVRAERKRSRQKPLQRERRRCRPIRNIEKLCRTGVPGYDPWASPGDAVFDSEAAKAAIRFFEKELTHCKGDFGGKPFSLEDWQRAIVGNLYGWLRPDGRRRYRRALIYIPRKNGKTIMCAGLALAGLFLDDEMGAEIYTAACEYKQASRIFEDARVMVLFNEDLKEQCKIYAGQSKAIQLGEQTAFSTLRPISSDSDSAHGFNVHMAFMDELHTQPDGELLDTLRTGTGSRMNPLVVCLTTADYHRESVCNREYDYACKVRDGIFDDPAYLPVVYEAQIDDDWTDPDVWAKANPNLGVSIREDVIAELCQQAVDDPTFENSFRRLHLNIRTEQDERIIQMSRWDECGYEINEADFIGCRCWAGLDIGATADLTAYCMLFPNEDEGGFDAFWRFWAPEAGAIRREQKDRVPYLTWARRGLITLTEGDETDYATVRRDINELQGPFPAVEIAADRAFQGAQLCQDLTADGLEVVPYAMTYPNVSAPTQELLRLINLSQFNHGGNPVVRWMASNLTVQRSADDLMRPSKDKSGDKIDGLVAAIIALGRFMVRERGSGRSVYEERGLRTL